jgi:hypothetical protein
MPPALRITGPRTVIPMRRAGYEFGRQREDSKEHTLVEGGSCAYISIVSSSGCMMPIQ